MTRRVRLIVAYDGTDFCGWAAQPGLRTVQSTLKEAVRQVSGEEIEIAGASRTDSGAHARGQVCHFDTDRPIPPDKWTLALNRVLPLDLTVRRSTWVPDDFHSRFSARDRWYRYRIHAGPRDPERARYVHEEPRSVDVAMMAKAGCLLVGTHDFRAFTEELDPAVHNTVRTLRSVAVTRVHDEVRIDIVGTAFLRGMMRRMAGALLEVGLGRRDADTIPRLLDPSRRNDLTWPVVLPARGLTLMRVTYGRHPRDIRLLSDHDLGETAREDHDADRARRGGET